MIRDKALQTRVTEKEFKRFTKIAKDAFGSVDRFLQFLIYEYKTRNQVTFALFDSVIVNGKKYTVTTSGQLPVIGMPTIILTPCEMGDAIKLEIVEQPKITVKAK